MSIASLTVDLTANLAKFEADMGKGAQIANSFAEKATRAQQQFLRALERTSERLGKTESDFLRVKAAELGVSDAAEKLITRIEETGSASTRAAAAGSAAFTGFADIVGSAFSKQKATVAELVAGIQKINLEASRLRGEAIGQEKAGTIDPNQLKARLTNIGAGRADAISQLKEAAAAQQAETAALERRAAATEKLIATVQKLNFNAQATALKEQAAAEAAEADAVEKRAGATERLVATAQKLSYGAQQAALREQVAAEEAAAAAVLKRQAATEKLIATSQKLTYDKQQAALKAQVDEQEAAAAAAAKAAQAQQNAAQNFVKALEAESAAIGKTRAEMLALKAEQLNVSDAVRPFIDRIAQAEKNIGKFGRQTGITQYELQTLHYTVSDVVASLASGISPMTILLQQGGQVRDVFGSFGRVFSVIGQLLTPARLLFGGVAGAVGALAYAFYEGSKQSKEFADALTLTGNAAGQTQGQFDASAKAIAASGQVSIGKVREYGAALANTGEIGPRVFKVATEAATRYGEATGKNAKEVATDFASMGQDVAKWAAEHNRQLNFISSKEYDQIRALQESGRAAEAQGIVYDALNRRLGNLEGNLGYLDRAIRTTKNLWTDFWDAAFDVGRSETIEDKLAKTNAQLAALEARRTQGRAANPAFSSAPPLREADTQQGRLANLEVEKNQERNQLALKKIRQDDVAFADAERASATKAAIAFDAVLDAELVKAKNISEKDRRLEVFRAGFRAKAEAGTPVPKSLQDAAFAQIEKDFTDKGVANDADAVRKSKLAQDLKRIQDAFEQEKEAVAFGQQELSARYQLGATSVSEYFSTKRELIEKGIEDEAQALRQEQARLQRELATGAFKDPHEKIDVQTKLNEAVEKEEKVRRAGARAIVLANYEATGAFRDLANQVSEYRAQLLQLEGDELGAAQQRAQVAIANARIFSQHSGGFVTEEQVERQKRAINLANDFAEAQRQVARAGQTAQLTEELYLIQAEKTGATLYQQERDVSEARSIALVQLGELVKKTAELAAQSDDPRIKLSAAELAVQYAKAAQSVDVTLNRLRAGVDGLAASIANTLTLSNITSGYQSQYQNRAQEVDNNKKAYEQQLSDLHTFLARSSDEKERARIRDQIKEVESKRDAERIDRASVALKAVNTDILIPILKQIQDTTFKTLVTDPLQQVLKTSLRSLTEGDNPIGRFFKNVLGFKGPEQSARDAETLAIQSSTTAVSQMSAAANLAAAALQRIAAFSGPGGASFSAAVSADNNLGGGFGTGSQFGNQDLGLFLHGGGVAGYGGDMRSVPAGTFAGARRYHRGGLAADEVPAILRRGEEVLTESDSRHRNNMRGGGGNVYIQNNAPTDVSARRDDSGDWQVFVEVAAEKGAQRGQARVASDLRSGTGPNAYALKGRGVPMNRALPRRS